MAILIGNNGSYFSGVTANNREWYGKWTCSESGTAVTFSVYSAVSGNVKVAIYADSSGPGTRIAVNNSGTAVTSGWNDITIADVSLSSGTDYWLGAIADTNSALSISSTEGGDSGYIDNSYSSGMPSTVGSFDSTSSWHLMFYASSTDATDLGGGTFSYSGGTIAETQSIQQSLIGGTFSFSGGDLPDSTIGDLIQEDLDGGIFSYSGGDIGSNIEIIETLMFGTFSYSGGSLIEETLIAPLLDSISDETITSGQAGITITGSNFSSATLELCNSSNYDGATVKVSQSITAQTSTTITFTCDHDDQLFGYKYLFVTNSNGARNLIGFKVNVGRTVYAFVTNDAGSRSDGHEITMFEGETNFLEDGDMEYADVSQWDSTSGGVPSKSSETRPGTNGILSLRIDVNSSDNYAGVGQMCISSGPQYRITGWALCEPGIQAAIGNTTGISVATFPADTWTYFDETFTSSGQYVYLGYYDSGGGINPGDYVLFDDVKIVKT